jgi:dihydroflavonol-4-reductase
VNAIVTGGAGFIGAHLVRQLAAEGFKVRVVERPGANLDNVAGLNVSVLTADVSIPGAVRPAMDNCDVLFHLAANPHLWTRNRADFRRINTEGTRNVLASARDARIPRVVHTSTESIIGPSRNGQPCNEDTPARARDMVGKYCVSKFLAEQAALEAAAGGQDVVIVNPTIPVGPGDINRSPATRLVVDFLNGRVPACMECSLNLVDVRDVARGHILAFRKGVPGRRYILGHENVGVMRLLEIAGEICGRPAPAMQVPYAAGLIVAYLSEFVADYITGREPAATVTGVKLTRRMARLDCSRAHRELGFQPGDVRDAIADAVAWYQQRGWIQRLAARAAAA